MINVDYLIVGAGIAGLCMARQCQLKNKSFLIIDDSSRTSSKIAGGMFNPVVLKRFTSIWESQDQLNIAYKFYPHLEEELKQKFFHRIPIYRKFASIEEQNNWFVACDNPITSPFLNPKLETYSFLHIPSPYGLGEVFDTGYLDVGLFVKTFQNDLKEKKNYIEETFLYEDLSINENYVDWKNIRAKSIVFAEGFSMHNNPFFNYLPLDGTKGELLYVRIPDLKLKSIVKSGVFIIPIGDDEYKVGATYNWQDKTDVITEEAKNELLEGLEGLIDCPYEVIEHFAGIRPTVKDRRPLVGPHYKYKNLYLLNGLGTRGVLLGPYLSEKLLLHIEEGLPLDKNIDVSRYYKKLQLIK